MEAETLESISEAPLPQAQSIGYSSNFVLRKRSAEVFRLLRNQRKGKTPAMHWLSPVASAAPATPMPSTCMNRKSRSIFEKPAASTTPRAKPGFSATMR